MKRSICHELLHTHMHRDEAAHDIIRDVEVYLTCFKNKQARITFK